MLRTLNEADLYISVDPLLFSIAVRYSATEQMMEVVSGAAYRRLESNYFIGNENAVFMEIFNSFATKINTSYCVINKD